jgi:hypothetical protein
MKIHVCLISAQAAPNLLPTLDPALKPDTVVLLVSGKMQRAADALAAVLKALGIRIDIVSIGNEHDHSSIEQTLLEVAAAHDGHEILLNLTGGTKLMALVAQSVANEAGWRSFYVDVDTDTVTWLDRKNPPQQLGEQLRLRHYLQSYGFELPEAPTRPQISRAQRELTETLIHQIGSLEVPITQLNWLAQQAEEKQRLAIGMDQRQQDSRALEALLRHFSDAGVLHVERDSLIFADEAARDFAKGGWLEHHVYDRVAFATGPLKIRDKAINLTVRNQGVANELDIALMARNRLFIIECKTARMDKPEAPKANDTLFKLAEVCRRVGGLGTRGMLASYRPLREPEKKLAHALNIELACGRELASLDDRLRAWIGT